jgi:hypothetical protein
MNFSVAGTLLYPTYKVNSFSHTHRFWQPFIAKKVIQNIIEAAWNMPPSPYVCVWNGFPRNADAHSGATQSGRIFLPCA